VHVDTWKVDTDGKKAGAIIGLLALGVVMYAVLFLYKLAFSRMKAQHSLQKWGLLGVCGLLYFIYVSIGYLLMLAAMSFITGVFFAVVVGITMGKVLFEHVVKLPGKQEESSDQCCH
jgi:hypothetical protein